MKDFWLSRPVTNMGSNRQYRSHRQFLLTVDVPKVVAVDAMVDLSAVVTVDVPKVVAAMVGAVVTADVPKVVAAMVDTGVVVDEVVVYRSFLSAVLLSGPS